jgi:hypothetical protein
MLIVLQFFNNGATNVNIESTFNLTKSIVSYIQGTGDVTLIVKGFNKLHPYHRSILKMLDNTNKHKQNKTFHPSLLIREILKT